jgi:hypothetical protein
MSDEQMRELHHFETEQRYERLNRWLMLDAHLHPEMTLAEFLDRHGISYDD